MPPPVDREKLREAIQVHGGIPIPCKGGGIVLFTRDQYHWRRAVYRELDVTLEIVKLVRWCKMNPDKMVPREGIHGLVTNWLKNAERSRQAQERIRRAEEIETRQESTADSGSPEEDGSDGS